MEKSDIPCVFCRYPIVNWSGHMNGWVHEDTLSPYCEPRLASPDFIFKDNIRRAKE